jgi:hypothetical protein
MIETGESETIFQKAILEQVRRGGAGAPSTGQQPGSAGARPGGMPVLPEALGGSGGHCWSTGSGAAPPSLLFCASVPQGGAREPSSCACPQGRGYVMDTLAEIRERRDAGGRAILPAAPAPARVAGWPLPVHAVGLHSAHALARAPPLAPALTAAPAHSRKPPPLPQP